MRRKVTALALLLAFSSFTFVFSQNKITMASRLNRVVDKVRIKDQQWELRLKVLDQKKAMAGWRSGKQEALVKIFEYDSEAEAITAFRSNERMMTNAGIPAALKNLGDEANLWADKPPRGTALTFRKGTILVLVNADSAQIARKFANYVREQL